MKFNYLIEKILKDIPPVQNGRAVFTFGRMNPPTLGHEMLIAKVVDIGRKDGRESFIMLSRNSEPKKNPIPFNDKLNALNAALPRVNFIDSEHIITLFDAVKYLISKGYTDLILVCGGDRVQNYTALFEPYKNHADPEKRLGYDNLSVVSAGERDPDSDDVSGISGTKARELAVNGDFESFKKILPTGMPVDQAEVLFNDIKQNYKPAAARIKKA
jgi:hypothetical protein